MTSQNVIGTTTDGHFKRFAKQPDVVAYAPGRIEVLGNHTDYNDGFVLSAAINMGTVCAISHAESGICRLAAPDMSAETEVKIGEFTADCEQWVKYITGVAALLPIPDKKTGCNMTVSTNIPIGSGLSSSAALETACAFALCSFYGIPMGRMEIAKLCQRAENEYTGAKCGLLDQISSIFGVEHSLIFTDFRTLEISTVKIPDDICFLMADTQVKHALVDSEYNERRRQCESAAEYFSEKLSSPVKALRDVSLDDWHKFQDGMDNATARRARHVVEENQRVLDAAELIRNGDCPAFGRLMFNSHESSRVNFENSCPELDFIVDSARTTPCVMGARLSGGGFGGSAVIMVSKDNAQNVITEISEKYSSKYGHPCDIRAIVPSGGARLITEFA